MTGGWHHRGPCTRHWCSVCGSGDCFAWTPDDELGPEIHICAAGCDGLPAAISGMLA
jgi:hypothetical protein